MPYASAGDLRTYYEVHGEGRPLILLHGAYMTAETMAPLTHGLAGDPAGDRARAAGARPHRRRRPPAHATSRWRTTPRRWRAISMSSRPTSSASAWAAGPRCSWRSAIRRWCGGSWSSPRASAPTPCCPRRSRCSRRSRPRCSPAARGRTEYRRLAPDPGGFPALVEKLKTLHTTDFAWPEEDIRGIAAPTLIVLGDSDAPPRARGGAVRAARRRVMGDLPAVAARGAARHEPHACRPAPASSTARSGCAR